MNAPALKSRRPDDVELVRLFRAGNENAFDEIVLRYRPKLLAFAARLLGSRRDDADDVVQEALMRAHRSLRRDDRPMNLQPWLYTLTRNCCLDELSRTHSSSIELDAPAAQLSLIDAASPPEIAERRAGMREMIDEIACLPATQRHALVRRELEGASHEEIAEELGVTPLASRSLVHRARQALVADRSLGDDERCERARHELLNAHASSTRMSARTHRHLLSCASCRAYRSRVRAFRRAIHALEPGVGLIAALAAIKGGAAAGKASGLLAGGAAKISGGTTGVVAAVGVVAIGGTLIATSGEPSPVRIKSPVVPGGLIRAGAPLPAGTATVTRSVVLAAGRASAQMSCPNGFRAADLLAPNDPAVTAAYRGGPAHGTSRHVTVDLIGRSGASVGVTILCRVPDATGAVVPASGARAGAAAPGSVVTVCVRRAYLRDRPTGKPRGSVSLGEPVELRSTEMGWRKVRTQFRAVGWLPDDATCG